MIAALAVAILVLVFYLYRRRNSDGSEEDSPENPDESPHNEGNTPRGGFLNELTEVDPGKRGLAYIECIAGQFSGSKKKLSQKTDCVFGKDPSVCTIVFDSNAKRVSRKHCRIHYSKSNACFVVQDLDSTNGTILERGVQQRQVPTETSLGLKNGDHILIPDSENVFIVHLP